MTYGYEQEFATDLPEPKPERLLRINRGAARAFGAWYIQENRYPLIAIRTGLEQLQEAVVTGQIRDIRPNFFGDRAVEEIKYGYAGFEAFLTSILSAPAIQGELMKGGNWRIAFPYGPGKPADALRHIPDGMYYLNDKVFPAMFEGLRHGAKSTETSIMGFSELIAASKQPEMVRAAAQGIADSYSTLSNDSWKQIANRNASPRFGTTYDFPDALMLQATGGKITPVPILRR